MFEQLKYNLKHNRRSIFKVGGAWFLFGAIIAVFIFADMGRQTGQGNVASGGAAAEVNDAQISIAQYAAVLERLRSDPRVEQARALGADAERQFMASLQQEALEQLVDAELLRQATDKMQIWTTDAEVRDFIFSIPQFQDQGAFQRDLYKGYLAAVRKTSASFENEVRRDKAIQRTVRLFGAALRPLPLESEKQKVLADMRANIEFVSVPLETLVTPESINQADIAAYVADSSKEGALKDYYQSHKADFSSLERIKVRHILVRAPAGDAEAEKKALAKIEELAAKAKTEDFAKLATQHSEDPGTKAKGGLLDFFSRGRMVPEFEEVAFALPVNEVSRPVKTQYGYHLIQVLEKQPANERAFEEVRNEIAAQLIASERSRQAVGSLQEALKNGNEAAVRQFVADRKLKWEETGAFSIDTEMIPKIGPNEDVARIAFQLSSEKPLAQELVRQGGTAFVLRHKPVPAGSSTKTAKTDPKSSQTDFMAEIMARRRSEDVLQQWVSAMRKDASISINPQVVNRR